MLWLPTLQMRETVNSVQECLRKMQARQPTRSMPHVNHSVTRGPKCLNSLNHVVSKTQISDTKNNPRIG